MLPTIDLIINGKKVTALVGTGCSQSIIAKKQLSSNSKVIRLVDVVTMGGIIRCEDVIVKLHHPTSGCLMDALVLSVHKVINKYDMIMGMDLIKTCDGLKISSGKLEFCNLLLKLASAPRDATTEVGISNAYFGGEKWIVS